MAKSGAAICQYEIVNHIWPPTMITSRKQNVSSNKLIYVDLRDKASERATISDITRQGELHK